MLKATGQHFIYDLENILFETLKHIPHDGVEIEPVAADADSPFDLIMRVHIGKRTHHLLVAAKTSAQPRQIQEVINATRIYVNKHKASDPVVIAAPYLSPRAREMCREERLNYVDLHGNALLSFAHVYIDKETTSTPKPETRELKSLYKPKSARVLRQLLDDPDKVWSLSSLSGATGVSLGHVSNVRNRLRDRGWLAELEGRFKVSYANEILDEWRENYDGPGGLRLHFYTPHHGKQFDDATHEAIGFDADASLPTLFASFSAAKYLAPFVRGITTTYVYAPEQAVDRLKAFFELTSTTETRANFIITIPDDEGVFFSPERGKGNVLTTAALQTYLDLYLAGERGQEAAEYLRSKRLQWLASTD